MAAKKPGRAGSKENTETTPAPAAGVGGDAPLGGTGTRTPSARKAASAGAGSGGPVAEGSAGGGTRARKTGAKSASAKSASAKSASKTASKSASKSASAKSASKRSAGDKGGSDLQSNLRAFVQHHPEGWQHGDWEGLLHHLREGGIDTSDQGSIGLQLERERVIHTLENSGVSGIRGAKAKSIADRYGRIDELRQASVDDLAGVEGISRQQAEKIQEAVR
jgi:hypothetical protein